MGVGWWGEGGSLGSVLNTVYGHFCASVTIPIIIPIRILHKCQPQENDLGRKLGLKQDTVSEESSRRELFRRSSMLIFLWTWDALHHLRDLMALPCSLILIKFWQRNVLHKFVLSQKHLDCLKEYHLINRTEHSLLTQSFSTIRANLRPRHKILEVTNLSSNFPNSKKLFDHP